MKRLRITVTTEDGIVLDMGEMTLPVGKSYTKVAFRPLKSGECEQPDEDTLQIGSQWETE